MKNIANYKPNIVFEYFKEITKIPHGSGNTSKLADYCLDFAKKRGYRAVKEEIGNVVIYADGTKGYEHSEPIIIQGHLDMVCEQSEDSNVDMDNCGVTVCTDGDFIYADKTTLGADNGIAIAYILAILDSDDIPHPPIEALLTVDEEVGMVGARALDVSLLKGKKLINIDSEEEGILTVSCAGGVRAYCEIPLNFVKTESNMISYKIEIKGLLGGHSGIDINKHRKNSNVLMGRLLQHISRKADFFVSDVNGGKKTNVIPKQSQCVICSESNNAEYIEKAIADFDNIIKKEISLYEPDVSVNAEKCELPQNHTDSESTKKLIFTLLQIPNGVQSMSPDMPNMVQTSLSCGVLSIEENDLKMAFFIRSNASTGKQLTVQKLISFIEYLDGSIEFRSDYPAWEYRADSPLRETMIKAYEEVYLDSPKISALHAGLECGILSARLDNCDMISFGPDIFDAHTPKERVSIESVSRCWNYLLKILEMSK